MSHWINKLYELANKQCTCVLATLARKSGNSPAALGESIIFTKNRTFAAHHDQQRTALLKTFADKVLLTEQHWSRQNIDLRPVVGRENGSCDYVFQFLDFKNQPVPTWLSDAKAAIDSSVTALLVLSSSLDHQRLYVHSDKLPQFAALSTERRFGHSNEVRLHIDKIHNDEFLLLPIRPNGPKVAVAGDSPLALALIKNLQLLPAQIIWLESQSSDKSDIDTCTGVRNAGSVTTVPLWEKSVQQLPAFAKFVVVTGDHELDLALCAAALRHPNLSYIGCVGSIRKSQLLRHELKLQGIEEAPLARLHCPIGLPQIAGKAPAVIAISIIAQILSLHTNVS